MYCVYRHIRKDKNEVFYIGIGNSKRPYSKSCRNYHWRNIVKNTPYEIEILAEGLTWEQAIAKEREFISLYGREDLGNGTLVNLTDGGEGNTGYVASKTTRQKQSAAKKGRKLSKETKLKISEGNKGKTVSEETRIRYSIAKRGVKRPKQTIEHIEARRASGCFGSRKKPVKCLNNGIVYNSATEAAEKLGITNKHIGTVCNGKRTHTNGYKFEYAI